VGWLLDPKHQIVWTRITTGIFLFLALIVLSSVLAYWPEVSWKRFMDYFNWVVIYFVLTQTVTTRQRFYILLLIFFLASFKLSLFGARFMVFHGIPSWGLSGPPGFFANPGELAIQMLVFAPLVLFFVLAIRPYLKPWQTYLLYLLPVTAAMTVLGTNSRGGQIALAIQLLALVLMLKQRFRILLFVAIAGTIGYQILPAEQKARFDSAGQDGTSMQRLLYWKHGWQMIKDHPVLGVGYFNFAPYYARYHSDDIVLKQVWKRDTAQLPHNIFIQVGTDTGFTGLAIFLFLITSGYLMTRRIGKEALARGDPFVHYLATGMNVSLLGFLVAGQFVTVTYYPFLWIHLAFVTMMNTFWQDEKRLLGSDPGKPSRARRVVT
jgi:probable O-glycosylation ligase (exosortase A-associated)